MVVEVIEEKEDKENQDSTQVLDTERLQKTTQMDLDMKQHMEERNKKLLDDQETLIKDFGMHGTEQGNLEIIA